jgi:hypothetical protein
MTAAKKVMHYGQRKKKEGSQLLITFNMMILGLKTLEESNIFKYVPKDELW